MGQELQKDSQLPFFISFSGTMCLLLLLEAFAKEYPENEILVMIQQQNKEK